MVFGTDPQPQQVINAYSQNGHFVQYVGNGCTDKHLHYNESKTGTYEMDKMLALETGYIRDIDVQPIDTAGNNYSCFRWNLHPDDWKKADIEAWGKKVYCYDEYQVSLPYDQCKPYENSDYENGSFISGEYWD
jgi:hypothetical protein